MIVIGIDPGITGAIAIVLGHGPGASDAVLDMPVEPRGKTGRQRLHAAGVARLVQCAGRVRVFLEHAQASPQMGVSGAFSYGESFGVLLGALAAHGYIPTFIRPQVWKKSLGLKRDKRKSLILARRLYPHLAHRLTRAKDHNRAEALLIAHYGMSQLTSVGTAA